MAPGSDRIPVELFQILTQYAMCRLPAKPLFDTSFANIFSYSIGCLLAFLMVSFAVQKFISLIRSHLLIFVFISFAWETDPRKHWYDCVMIPYKRERL